MNDFGMYLLNICEQFGFQIINGTTCGDECGNFTYVSSVGCSVMNYLIVSTCLLLSLTMSLKVAQKIDSKHMPVELTVESQSNRAVLERKRTKNIYIREICLEPRKQPRIFVPFIFGRSQRLLS